MPTISNASGSGCSLIEVRLHDAIALAGVEEAVSRGGTRLRVLLRRQTSLIVEGERRASLGAATGRATGRCPTDEIPSRVIRPVQPPLVLVAPCRWAALP